MLALFNLVVVVMMIGVGSSGMMIENKSRNYQVKIPTQQQQFV